MSRSPFLVLDHAALALLSLLILAGACQDLRCPNGFDKVGDVCRRHDAGTMPDDSDGAADEEMSEPDAEDPPRGVDGSLRPPGDAGMQPSPDASALMDGSLGAEASTPTDDGSLGAEASTAVDGSLAEDPCKVANGGCPANSDCSSPLGIRTCTCRPAFEQSANGQCVDKCVTAGCDVHATCAVAGTSAVCTCTPPYVGTDGKICAFDQTCSLLGCHAQASCVVSGQTRACQCNAGYTGSGVGANGCTDVDECLTNNGGCDQDPRAGCTNDPTGADSTVCSCPSGYSGRGVGANGCSDINECLTNNGGCDQDPRAGCANDPTGADSTVCSCPSGYSGTGVGANGCSDINECLTNNGGCAPVATCTNDPTGTDSPMCRCPANYVGDRCEEQICSGDVVIGAPADLQTYRSCREIRGNLNISTYGLSVISANDFPFLISVTGAVNISPFVPNGTPLTSITLAKLQTVGGQFSMASPGNDIREVHVPALTSTKNFESFYAGGLRVLDTPRLATINGDVSLAFAPVLCDVNFPLSQVVTGEVFLFDLPKVTARAFATLRQAAAGRISETNVGCCFTNSVDMSNCTSVDPDPTGCGC